MAAYLLILLLATAVSGSHGRYYRDTGKTYPGADGGSGSSTGGAGAFSGASASSFSSSTGTKVAPGPGGYGNFNAFAGNFGGPPSFAGAGMPSLFRGPGDMGAMASQTAQPPFGFSGFNPFIPQYGQQYPYMPFQPIPAPFDFTAFLNQYFQALQNFQAQAAAQAQQAANSGNGVYQSGPGYSVWPYHYPKARSLLIPIVRGGLPLDSNDVGGVGGMATATYGPQGGYGSANVFPAPEGALETRFGGEDGGSNMIGGAGAGPVGSVSGSFKPPGGSSFGVFTSSASGSSDINGKKTSFKQSSIGINDNGKVTTYTAHDP